MNREVHVRFWEGLRVRFPRATHFADFVRGTYSRNPTQGGLT